MYKLWAIYKASKISRGQPTSWSLRTPKIMQTWLEHGQQELRWARDSRGTIVSTAWGIKV